jgi:hypothetical protein
MTRSAKIFFGLYVVASLFALVLTQARASSADPRLSKVRGYQKWLNVTPEPVYMQPAVSALCSALPPQPSGPHAATFFRVYVNPAGRSAMTSRTSVPFAVGSVIVKEKFKVASWDSKTKPKIVAGAKPELLTVMLKREKGFDPKNGDWEYFTCDGNGIPNSPGLKVDHCQSCHQAQKKTDFVYRDYQTLQRL